MTYPVKTLAMCLLIGCVAPVPAGDRQEFLFWSASQLDNIEKKLHLHLDEPGKGANEKLMTSPKLSALMAYREGMPPQAEIHQKLGDFALIRDGDAAVLIGGKIADGKQSAPDEIRGTITGGTMQTLKAGDVIYIPPNMPHQWQIQPGKRMYLELFKIQPKSNGTEQPKYLYWSAGQLAALDKKLKSSVDASKSSHEDLVTERFNTVVVHREGSAGSEVHQHLADFDIVRSGQGFMVLGGKMVEGKPTGPGEVRGKSIEGGTKQRVAAGDLLYIPANMPHQFLAEPGQQFDVMVLKVWVQD